MSTTDTRIDELDKTEWFDIARKLKPGLTAEEYDAMWASFQEAKAEHQRQQGLQ